VTHGHGNAGYAEGEKIVIKVNFVGCHAAVGGVDPESYDLIEDLDYMNTSPQMILALLRDLVDVVGVEEDDISVGDTTALYPNQYHDHCHTEYPGVHYLDRNGGNPSHPRTQVEYSTIPFYWSCHPSTTGQDHIPRSYAEAKYLINLSNFKSHGMAGVTMGAKNHYGSLIRYPYEAPYYDMHTNLPSVLPTTPEYREPVDMLGHAQLGGQTLLSLVDGLYSGVHGDDAPRRWSFPPFNNDWTSSLFVAQDPVAIESVCFDFMQEEGDPRAFPQRAGANDYLHEAALAYDPPSGTFYDPDHEGDVQRLPSLGVHEHWNNSTDKQYTRNLGAGEGIELIAVYGTTAVSDPDAPAGTARGAAGVTITAYPNPFNPATSILYELPAAMRVSLRIYDAAGRLVRTVHDGELMTEGIHRTGWNGMNETGQPAPSAVYLCRLTAGTYHRTARLVLIR
jgi:hypothetical protein